MLMIGVSWLVRKSERARDNDDDDDDDDDVCVCVCVCGFVEYLTHARCLIAGI